MGPRPWRPAEIRCPPRHPVNGALLCLAALALFACMDTTTKYLAASHAVPLIVGVRYLGNLALMVAFSARRTGGRWSARSGPAWCCCARCASPRPRC